MVGADPDAAAKKPVPGKATKATQAKKQSFLSSVTDALDFSEVRSKSDARLLYDAKYGDRKGGRLSPEQAAALRRKVGGTAKDYWKDWVDVKGDYVDKGYVSSESGTVTGLPFLIAVVFGLFVALGVVVSQTS
ncbi:hypothetical protein WJX72_010529 [[Myrmecia] bisecta]|uniref:Uncharacterized protein n=1 Tax=[Myrmecia] bisecta TaxID=41462 RepID=A0AAW1PED6_9CHLO